MKHSTLRTALKLNPHHEDARRALDGLMKGRNPLNEKPGEETSAQGSSKTLGGEVGVGVARSNAAKTPPWIVPGLIVAIAAVYAPVAHFGFVTFDDPHYVVENP